MTTRTNDVASHVHLHLDRLGTLPAFRIVQMIDGPLVHWQFGDAAVWMRPGQLFELDDLVRDAIVAAALLNTDTGDEPARLELPFPAKETA